MPVTALARLDLTRPGLVRVVRCLAVSVATTLLSVGILVALTIGARAPAGPANAIGVICGIPVSYLANRRWVWRRRGPSTFRTELVPFWTLGLLGLVTSTIVVGRVGFLTASLDPRGARRSSPRPTPPRSPPHGSCSSCCWTA
jgi:putative flippase GtrA